MKADRYPVALAALERLLQAAPAARPKEADRNNPAILDADASRQAALLVGYIPPGMRPPRALPSGRLDADPWQHYSDQPPNAPLAGFAIGPAVLRQPPARAEVAAPGAPLEPPADTGTEQMLGELVDMVLVSADDEAGSGRHEVHLVFKAEVLGGLHLKLVRRPDGMHATFVVEDAAARRAVASHVDDLVAHLRGRGLTIAHHTIELASP